MTSFFGQLHLKFWLYSRNFNINLQIFHLLLYFGKLQLKSCLYSHNRNRKSSVSPLGSWSSSAPQSCGCKTCDKIKSSGKQKRSLCASDCWQPAPFRTNDRSVVQLPPGALAETEWEIFSFPSHTHNWPRGVSLNPDIQRILCFNMITVWTLVVGGERHQYTHHLYNSERWKRRLAARVALCWCSGKQSSCLENEKQLFYDFVLDSCYKK